MDYSKISFIILYFYNFMDYIKILYQIIYFNRILKISEFTINSYKNKKINNIKINNINIDNSANGTLIITNHISALVTIKELFNYNFKELYEILITDLLLIIKSINTNKKINQIYFPAYNKNLVCHQSLNNFFKLSTSILNNISETTEFLGFEKKINIIYSYKSTPHIIDLLAKGEIVIIMYIDANILKYNKIKYIQEESNCQILPLKLSKINDNNYDIIKYSNKIMNFDFDNYNKIKSFLFNIK